jgi:hypothetical protein
MGRGRGYERRQDVEGDEKSKMCTTACRTRAVLDLPPSPALTNLHLEARGLGGRTSWVVIPRTEVFRLESDIQKGG